MQNKIKVLHVVPTLKRDGAEVQLSKIFKQFKYVEVELFTFDMYELSLIHISSPRDGSISSMPSSA